MTENVESRNTIVERAERRFKLENEKKALTSIKTRLDSLRFWTPAPQMSKVVEETLSVINGLEERLEAKAVVAVVGVLGQHADVVFRELVDDFLHHGGLS